MRRWRSQGKGRSIRERLAWVVLSALLLVNSGCLLAVGAAAAGGAAAVGYLYYKEKGALYRDYPASLDDSAAAVRDSLAELEFPPLPEEKATGEITIYTRTADGTKVHIFLDVIPSRIPVERPSTRISVRVGVVGDDVVAARILDQVTRHLVPGGTAVPPPPGVGATLGRPVPPETAAPPLAAPTSAARLTDLGAPARKP